MRTFALIESNNGVERSCNKSPLSSLEVIGCHWKKHKVSDELPNMWVQAMACKHDTHQIRNPLRLFSIAYSVLSHMLLSLSNDTKPSAKISAVS